MPARNIPRSGVFRPVMKSLRVAFVSLCWCRARGDEANETAAADARFSGLNESTKRTYVSFKSSLLYLRHRVGPEISSYRCGKHALFITTVRNYAIDLTQPRCI
jgi:hypothetical protein